jgi:hypothetical protein
MPAWVFKVSKGRIRAPCFFYAPPSTFFCAPHAGRLFLALLSFSPKALLSFSPKEGGMNTLNTLNT